MVDTRIVSGQSPSRKASAWRGQLGALAQVAGGIAGTFAAMLGAVWFFLLLAF